MNDTKNLTAIEISRNSYALTSKLLTLMNIVNIIKDEVHLPEFLTVLPFGTMEENTEITIKEMISDSNDDETIEEFLLSKTTEAVIYSTIDNLKHHTPIDIMESLYSHGINEILLFHIAISNNDTNEESREIISNLKKEIEDMFMDIVKDYTNEILTHDVITKFNFVRFYELKANCVLLECRNTHGLKILEER